MAKIKVSNKSLAKFKSKNIVKVATDFVKGSINMSKVKGAIKECLEKHPELLESGDTDVVVARILAQSLLYARFGNENLILWKSTATRKQKRAMHGCSFDMHCICQQHRV